MYHSDLLRAIFDNLDLDYKMLINLNLFIDPKIHFLVVILALTLYPSLLNTLYDEHLLAVCTSKCTGQKLYWLKYTLNCLRFKKNVSKEYLSLMVNHVGMLKICHDSVVQLQVPRR